MILQKKNQENQKKTENKIAKKQGIKMRQNKSIFLLLPFLIQTTLVFSKNEVSLLLPEESASGEYFNSGSPGVSDLIIESRLARLNELTPIELDYNKYVKDYILLFTTSRRKDMERILGLSGYYFPMIEAHLDRYQLPFEIKYLAVLESGLDPFAVSPSGAVGLWQFLLHSSRMFDLEVNSFIDERREPVKSTQAACRYLVYLHDMFQDWHLVLASYNGGPGAVRTAIERSGGKKNFWEIKEFLPEQTRNYVPAFIAITYLMSYYVEHDITPHPMPVLFERTDTIWPKQPLSIQSISQVLKIPADILSLLNPAYKTGYVPNTGKKVAIVIPSEYISSFYEQESNIYSFSTNKEPGHHFSNQLKKTDQVMVTHKVVKGEFLHKIAVRYRSTPEQIRIWNRFNGDLIYENQELVIWVSEDFLEGMKDSEKEQILPGKSNFMQ